MVMFNDSKFEILGMKTMKYILLVICVTCASTMMAVDYKLYQTSSTTFKSTSTSGYSSAGTSGGTRSLSAPAQGGGAMVSVPAVSFRSTSAMPSTGSSLSSAAVSGVITTDESDNSTITGPRRIGGGNSGGGDGPENPDDVWATPLGDMPWIGIALLAAGYAIYLRRKNSVRIPESGHQQ